MAFPPAPAKVSMITFLFEGVWVAISVAMRL
jgi:hypothetical protein